MCGGPFIISDTKPHNVKVYGLPWTTAITWEPEQAFNDPKGPEVRVILYWHSTYTYVFTSKKVAGTPDGRFNAFLTPIVPLPISSRQHYSECIHHQHQLLQGERCANFHIFRMTYLEKRRGRHAARFLEKNSKTCFCNRSSTLSGGC